MHLKNLRVIYKSMKQNNFSILEFRSIYSKKDNSIMGLDLNYNLVVSKKIFDEIKEFVLKNNEQTIFLKPTYKSGMGEVLQAQNYVGVIQTKIGTTIEILPKISNLKEDKSKEILVRMLKTLKKSPFKNFNAAHLKSDKMPLLEIFITMFLEELSKLIQKGLKSDYITKEENLKYLKGKLKINEQIKRNYIHKERFFVEYQEFLSDRVENRLIKTTLEFLYKKSKSNRNQQRIREFLFVFDEISSCKDIKIGFSKVRLDRQMKDYEQVLRWCRIFLLENSFSPYKGKDIAFALLFDMNLLFESYVGYYLKQKGLDVCLQDKGKYLIEEPNKFALKPDIVINKNKANEMIADTKWKILSEDKTHQGVSQNDMYQLYAYGTKYENCKDMFLIYPLDKIDKDQGKHYHYFKNKTCESNEGLNLKILFFDLTEDCQDDKFHNSFHVTNK
ncbi:MAG TPA: restriction endonuclease [Epsilonproteobacteria bacterium]|nr:restriction endonuclease [Campylobacterota bacterium]